jgi:FKBP-type peptidyl-prolyl cis-trans isomerase
MGIQNAIGEMDLDIIIDEAPDQITLQHEQFEQLAQMAQQGIPIPPEMLIEASSLTNKHELLQRMEQQQMQAMQAQQAQMQQEQQYRMAEAMASAERDMAAAMKDSAGAKKIAAETQDLQVETAQKVVGLR